MKEQIRYTALAGILMATSVAHAQTIDIGGTTIIGGGGEFADYTAATLGLPEGNNVVPWPASVVNDGTVSLSAGPIALDTTVSTAAFNNQSNYRGAGSEINFNQSNLFASAADVIGSGTFLSFQLDSTSFASASVTLDSISLSLWRNGAGASKNFQFAYDANANGFGLEDLLGSAINNTLADPVNAFTVSSPITSLAGTTHEVRLYYWGASNAQGNTHLFDVTAEYTVVPEPSTMALAFLGLGGLALFRKRS